MNKRNKPNGRVFFNASEYRALEADDMNPHDAKEAASQRDYLASRERYADYQRTVYVCERREFETLDDARIFADKFYQRDRTIVAITARTKRVRA